MERSTKVQNTGHLKFKSLFRSAIYWIGMLSLVGASFYLRTRSVKNPVVLPDEYAYFNYIKLLASQHQINTSQYGPLYVMLSSLFCDPSNVVRSYEKIRLMNLAIFTVAFIPLKLLASQFFKNNLSSTLFAFGFVLLPWSTLVTAMWAEPLFYMLYCWAWYFCFKSFGSEKFSYAALAGVSIGLMMLTKQAGGLILAIAYGSVFAVEVLFKRENRQKSWRKLATAMTPIVLTMTSYFALTKWVSVGGVGYTNVSFAISKLFFKVLFSYDLICTFMTQLAYLILSGFFIFPAAAVISGFDFREMKPNQRQFYLLVGFATFWLCLLIAFFMNTTQLSFNDPNESGLAYGRYLSPLIPPIVLIGAAANQANWKRENWRRNFGICLALIICMSIYSPLFSAWIYGLVNAPDMMYLSRFFRFDIPTMDRTIIEGLARHYRVWLALGAGAIGLFWLWIHTRRSLVSHALFCLGAIAVGQANATYIVKVSKMARKESEVYRYLARENVRPNELLRLGSYKPHLFMAEFWLGEFDRDWSDQATISIEELRNPSRESKGKHRYVLSNDTLPPEFENVTVPEFAEKLPLYRLPTSEV